MNANLTSTVRRTNPHTEVMRPDVKLEANTLPLAVEMPALPVVSLFCGAGGLDRGFSQVGFVPVLAIDKDEAACRTYEKNHGRIRVLRRDLASIPRGYVIDRISELAQDVKPVGVIGGPPCQAFSLSNRSPRRKDPRATLPENYAVILKELSKAYELDFFVFENVLGLRYKKHLDLFLAFKKLFASAGFSIFEGELDAQDFGVAQVRKRLFVVGFNKTKYRDLDFKFPGGVQQSVKNVRDVIGGLPKPRFFRHGLLPSEIPVHPNHWCMQPRSEKFFNGYLKEGDIKGRPFRVLKWDKPSWTVAYGHREVHIHPSGRRRLSVYEAMLLQGFPAEYELCGTLSDQIRLVSDAVPPPLATGLAEAIWKVITHDTQVARHKPLLFPICPQV
jgi:DNA (cytosine-5)-methyltransferase 1